VKKVLILLIAAVVTGYLIFSATYFRNVSRSRVCERFSVVIADSSRYRFVSASDIANLVKRYGLDPSGKTFGEINTLAIRDTILTNKLVESAEVFTTPGGSVVAAVSQRKPVLRVISDLKGNFYVDSERRVMPVSGSFTVYVPVATGFIDEQFALHQLYDFALFLNAHSEWDAWIEQIVVKKNREVELIPKAGDFRIIMGSLDGYRAKLDKFARFVDEGLSVVGWNRYSAINLKYDNQIVCTKK
jgi:cell division protein FtsQ